MLTSRKKRQGGLEDLAAAGWLIVRSVLAAVAADVVAACILSRLESPAGAKRKTALLLLL